MLYEREQSSKNERERFSIEPFVAAEEAAVFLGISRRRILQMARGNEIPGYPLGRGTRRTWRFRLSELAHALDTHKPASLCAKGGMINPSGPRQPNRRD
jgi:excisionase family DNA binding protein